MAFTYFGKSDPIEKGNKSVSTFSSGLCLVQQSYVIRQTDEEIYRGKFVSGETLDVVSPAVDGLYIFPDPQWKNSGNGFIEISVSAYGRVNTIGKTEISALLQSVPVFVNGVQSGNENVLATYLKIKLVTEFGVFPEINTNDLRDLFTFRKSDGSELNYDGFTTSVNFNLSVSRYDIVNFGLWDETTMTISPTISLVKTSS